MTEPTIQARGFLSQLRRDGAGALALFGACTLLVFTIGVVLQLRVHLGLGLVITELFCIAAPAAWFLRRRDRLRDSATFSRPPLGMLARVVIAAACAVLAGVVAGLLIRRGIGSVIDPQAMRGKGVGFSLLLAVFSLWVLAPVCEELLFRVAIQGSLARTLGPRSSVLAASGLFAVFHGALERVPETFLLGVCMGLIYQRTGRYWLCVAAHATANVLGPPMFIALGNVGSGGLGAVLAVVGLAALGGSALALPASAARPATWWGRDRRPPRTPDEPGAGRPLAVPAAIGAIVITALGILTLFHGLALRSEHLAPASEAPDPGACVQEWTLMSGDRLEVVERFTLETGLTGPLRIPRIASGASLRGAELEGRPVVPEASGDAWTLRADVAGARHIVLEWSLRLVDLEQSGDVHRIPPRPPVPISVLRMEFVLHPDSGYEDAHEPGRTRHIMLAMNTRRGQTLREFGTTGFAVRAAPPK